MSEWRDIPARYVWDGDSLTAPGNTAVVVSSPPAKVEVPLVTKPVNTTIGIPVIPASSLVVSQGPPESVNIDTKVEEVIPKPDLSTEEQAAAAKMEAMLDKVLALLGTQTETVSSNTNLSTGTPGTPLWDTSPQVLDPNKSPIYPAGRPITNPNHLMLMLWNGASICREYSPAGWMTSLRRGDKRNPISEVLFNALDKSGSIVAGGNGEYRIKER